MNINIEVIPNEQHRPGISGADWFWDERGDLQVRVSKMSDERYEICLAIHEAVEAIMCRHNGVSQQSVDDYDRPFEAAKDNVTNVGDRSDAPYRREHGFATAIERVLASELNVPWQEYDDELAKI